MALILPAGDPWSNRIRSGRGGPPGRPAGRWGGVAAHLRPGDVGELPGPVDLRPPVGAGGAVRQRDLHLPHPHAAAEQVDGEGRLHAEPGREWPRGLERGPGQAALAVERLGDRKSTRLNSSHVKISYAVFCLKKKKKKKKKLNKIKKKKNKSKTEK